MSATLRDLLAERHELDALVEAQDGELTPDLEALWDASNAAVKDKVESWGLWITRQLAVADAIETEVDRLDARKLAILNAVARSKDELQRQMEAAGLDKVKGVLVTVAVQQNNPSVAGELDEPTLHRLAIDGSPFAVIVPQTVKLDKRQVLDAAKQGQAIPEGLSVVRTRSLRIR